jgi:phosphatidylglycerol lysyltransferase
MDEVLEPREAIPPKKVLIPEALGVHLIAALTGLMGIINVLSVATPALATRLTRIENYVPLEVRRGSHLTATLAGFALLLLAGSLWRRKLVAWWLAVIVLGLSVLSHLIKGLDYEEAAIGSALLILLIAYRRHFFARSDRPSIQQGLWTLFFALLFTLFYGSAGFYLMDKHFSVHFSLFTAIRQAVVMFAEFYDPGLIPITHAGRFFADSIYIVGAATMGYALFMMVRPVLVRDPATTEEREKAGRIVETHGRSSLARMALFDDKSYFFSPAGSVIAFSWQSGIAVALGDPIGPEADFSAALAGFREYCLRNGWQSAFYQVLPNYLDGYRKAGFEALCIGQEAAVDLAGFSLEGSDKKNLRYALNRLTKRGFRAEMVMPPVPLYVMDQLREISNEWLANVHGTEQRFSVGWFDKDYVRSCPVMTIIGPEGRMEAFANVVREYQKNELAVDLMRHRSNPEQGLMVFVFVSLIDWATRQGFESFNLGLSALSGIGQAPGDPALEKALRYIFEHVNSFYNFKGLYEFKDKFHPAWSPRYLIYPNPASLLPVTLAVIRADTGGSFLSGYLRGKLKLPFVPRLERNHA